MRMTQDSFYIKSNNKEHIFDAIINYFRKGEKLKWISSKAVINTTCLQEAMEEIGYHLKYEHGDDQGDVIGIEFLGEKLGDEFIIWKVIAPYVEPNSFIEMTGYDGCKWRWVFKDGECQEIYPKTEW